MASDEVVEAARAAEKALLSLEWSDLFREDDEDPQSEIACPSCGAFQNPAGGHHGNCVIHPALVALRAALDAPRVSEWNEAVEACARVCRVLQDEEQQRKSCRMNNPDRDAVWMAAKCEAAIHALKRASPATPAPAATPPATPELKECIAGEYMEKGQPVFVGGDGKVYVDQCWTCGAKRGEPHGKDGLGYPRGTAATRIVGQPDAPATTEAPATTAAVLDVERAIRFAAANCPGWPLYPDALRVFVDDALACGRGEIDEEDGYSLENRVAEVRRLAARKGGQEA